MKTLLDPSKSGKIFEGEISECREINDNAVLFSRDGTIIAARSCDSKLRSGANIFDLMPPEEASVVRKLDLSFDYNRLVISTLLGAAIIYTDCCGVCGIMSAVFPLAPDGEVFSYFVSRAIPSAYISDGARALASGRGEDSDGLIGFCDKIFLTSGIMLARYRLGNDMIQSLTEYILRSAEFFGCVGIARGELDVRPSLDSFSPEMLAAMSHCCILFARENGQRRDFFAKICEYNSHLIVSFFIQVDENFELMQGNRYAYSPLNFCLASSDRRRTFFECYHRADKNAVIIAFAPEIDPLDGRIIKQDIEARLAEFWDIE